MTMNKLLKLISGVAVVLLTGSLSTLKAQEDISARNKIIHRGGAV